MILAIDMGNSNIKLGIVKNESEILEERVKTEYDKTSFQYAMDISMLLSMYGVEKEDFEGAIVSSVVPSLTPVLSAAVNKVIGRRPMVVGTGLEYNIGFGDVDVSCLGADLLAASEGALKRYPLPCIIVNMGTATTMMVVDAGGVFRGGVILPGMKTSLEALTKGTAVLPDVQLGMPTFPISYNTQECMRNGIVYGCAAEIDGITERMEEKTGPATVVATGGMAKFCVNQCKRKVIMDDSLIMAGLLEIYRLNAE